MPWPTPQDYNESLQTPSLSFLDPDLAGGQPELNRVGLPRAVSGNFANVYHVSGGGREWAVRCFLREVPDQQERYVAISRHLTRAGLKYMAGFAYQPDGIRVRGRWYPILKMEWLQGPTLGAYVAERAAAGDTRAVATIAAQWAEMVGALSRARIAHGDLQHGNVLVVGGRLRLIDYDCMYVPALDGRESPELGHRNYQHPRRSERDFGLHLDRFAAWVIYLSLLGVAADPALWPRFGAEERLLLGQEDFHSPAQSPVLQALAGSRDPRVRALAATFPSLCAVPPAQLPPLGAGLLPRPVQQPAIALLSPPPGARPAAAPAPWWREHVAAATPVAAPARPLALTTERLLAWSALLIWVASIVGLLGAHAMPSVAAAAGAAELGALLAGAGYRYRNRAEARRRREAAQRIRAADADAASLQRTIDGLTNDRAQVTQQELSALAPIQERLHAVRTRLDEALREVDRQLQQDLSRLAVHYQDLNLAEAAARATALEAHRGQTLQSMLAQHTVTGAVITGIGPLAKRTLVQSGYRTAADLPDHPLTLHGLTTRQGEALAIWRRFLVNRYAPGLPKAVPPGEAAALNARFGPGRRRLDQAEAEARARADRHRQQLSGDHRSERQALTGEAEGIRVRMAAARAEIDRLVTVRRDELAAQRSAADAARRELDATRDDGFLTYLSRLLWRPGA